MDDCVFLDSKLEDLDGVLSKIKESEFGRKVKEIDLKLKDIEQALNDELVLIPASIGLSTPYVPAEDNDWSNAANQITHEIWHNEFDNWNSEYSVKVQYRRHHFEELKYCKNQESKGNFGFFYEEGWVNYKIAMLYFDNGGEFHLVDAYYVTLEDKRDSIKVTGAPVKIKLRAVEHIDKLVNKVLYEAKLFHKSEKSKNNIPNEDFPF